MDKTATFDFRPHQTSWIYGFPSDPAGFLNSGLSL
jgi:hypothetical protein